MWNKALSCQIHEHAKNRYFCKAPPCNKIICQFCAENEHKNHEIVELSELNSLISQYEIQRMGTKQEDLSKMEEFLLELSKIESRIGLKDERFLREEEKIRFNFEQAINSVKTMANEKKSLLKRLVKELSGKIEICHSDSVNEIKKVKECFENVRKDYGEESLKNLLLCGGEKGKNKEEVDKKDKDDENYRKNNLEKFERIIKEIENLMTNYELLSFSKQIQGSPLSTRTEINTPTANLISPKKFTFPNSNVNSDSPSKKNSNKNLIKFEKLKINIPLTPRETFSSPSLGYNLNTVELDLNRQKDLLEKLKLKTVDAESNLKNLMSIIELRKKELNSLEKAKNEITKANEILRINMEKHNKIFAQTIDKIQFGNKKDEIITAEKLFIRKDFTKKAINKRKKLNQNVKFNSENLIKIKSKIQNFKSELLNLQNLIKNDEENKKKLFENLFDKFSLKLLYEKPTLKPNHTQNQDFSNNLASKMEIILQKNKINSEKIQNLFILFAKMREIIQKQDYKIKSFPVQIYSYKKAIDQYKAIVNLLKIQMKDFVNNTKSGFIGILKENLLKNNLMNYKENLILKISDKIKEKTVKMNLSNNEEILKNKAVLLENENLFKEQKGKINTMENQINELQNQKNDLENKILLNGIFTKFLYFL